MTRKKNAKQKNNERTHQSISIVFGFFLNISLDILFFFLFSEIFTLLLFYMVFLLFQYKDNFFLYRFLSKKRSISCTYNCLRKTVFSFIAKSNGIRVKYTWIQEHTQILFLFSHFPYAFSPCFLFGCVGHADNTS